jgi:hypothetical protein
MVLPQFPTTRAIISKYMYEDPSLLGPHWEQPGRSIVCGLYRDIPWPSEQSVWDWASRKRIEWTGQSGEEPLILKKEVDWPAFEGEIDVSATTTFAYALHVAYARTFSSLHNYQVANPDDAKEPEGDIVTRFIAQVKESVIQSSSDQTLPEKFELAWPLGLMLISRD